MTAVYCENHKKQTYSVSKMQMHILLPLDFIKLITAEVLLIEWQEAGPSYTTASDRSSKIMIANFITLHATFTTMSELPWLRRTKHGKTQPDWQNGACERRMTHAEATALAFTRSVSDRLLNK
jgi:hypothetical protein